MTNIINAVIKFLILYVGSLAAPDQIQIKDWNTAVVFTAIYIAVNLLFSSLTKPIEISLAKKQAHSIVAGTCTWQIRILGLIQLLFPFVCILMGSRFLNGFSLTTPAIIIVTLLFFALEYVPNRKE